MTKEQQALIINSSSLDELNKKLSYGSWHVISTTAMKDEVGSVLVIVERN